MTSAATTTNINLSQTSPIVKSRKSISGTRLSDIEAEKTARLEKENEELKAELENLSLQLNLDEGTGRGIDTQAVKNLAKGIKDKTKS